MHSTMRQEVPDYHRHQRPVHHPHPAHDHGVNGAAGAAASKTVYGDGSWQLSIFVTDLQVEKSLRVRGDLHIGGVMIKLVDSLGELITSNCFLVINIKQQQNISSYLNMKAEVTEYLVVMVNISKQSFLRSVNFKES